MRVAASLEPDAETVRLARSILGTEHLSRCWPDRNRRPVAVAGVAIPQDSDVRTLIRCAKGVKPEMRSFDRRRMDAVFTATRIPGNPARALSVLRIYIAVGVGQIT